MTDPQQIGLRHERASAADMAAFARWVSDNEPDRGAATCALAGGVVALTGRGLFVNRAMACGIDTQLTLADLDELETYARSAGVPSTVQVSDFTNPDVVPLLRARGYSADGQMAGVAHDLSNVAAPQDSGFTVDVVETDAQLAHWQEAAAAGWGHDAPDRRAASDTFAAAAHATQSPGLLLVRDLSDGRVVGCSALSIRDDLAILGGMSTLPSERRRGVQQFSILYRLNMAIDHGCTAAATEADPSGGSLRNLLRSDIGFVQSHTLTNWTRQL